MICYLKIHHAFFLPALIGKYNASHWWIFYQNKKPISKILRTDKSNNFKFTIKFLMTPDRSYTYRLSGFLGIDLFESVYGAICLIKLLFKMGLFTVYYLCMLVKDGLILSSVRMQFIRWLTSVPCNGGQSTSFVNG